MNISDLISKGYFPEELSPAFTTEDLTLVKDAILLDIDSLDPIAVNATKVITKITNFSIPKIKGYRRSLGIPHPLHFIRLADTIVNNWVDILAHCNRSTISLSPLKIRNGSSRALLKPSFKKTTREKIIRSTGRRYMLKIDITKFYGSIYTHSIPWALHTKPSSKANRRRLQLFGNALDEDVRKMQDGQTIGIPIGPDTSRIISEIILSAIDVNIQNELGYLDGVRIVDDYHLYFKSQEDLENARAIIHRSLRAYELELNPNKEKLLDLPEIIESEWFSQIREYKFRNRWDYQRTDLITFFDIVFSFARKYPDDIVLTYAMSKLRFTIFRKKNWAILQSLLLNALLIEPKILPYVAQNLTSYASKDFNVNKELILKSLENLITYHSVLGNEFEIVWSLWILKSLKINVSESIAKAISNNENPIVILTALDLDSNGYIPTGLDKGLWQSMLSQDNLYSELWLVAYEAKMKGWLTSPTDYIAGDPFFSKLQAANVSFYKEDRIQDLSKVKVSSAQEYFEEDIEEDNESDEPESVYISVSAPAISPVGPPEQLDDLPF